MSAMKHHLEQLVERLIAVQGIPENCNSAEAVFDLVMSGEIAPLDFSGINWERGGKTYRAHDRELLA